MTDRNLFRLRSLFRNPNRHKVENQLRSVMYCDIYLGIGCVTLLGLILGAGDIVGWLSFFSFLGLTITSARNM